METVKKMDLVKTLDTSATYYSGEYFWWMHNDNNPIEWSIGQFDIDEDALKALFDKWVFGEICSSYKYENQKNPMCLDIRNFVFKLDPESEDSCAPNNSFIGQISFRRFENTKSKKYSNLDGLSIKWDLSFDETAKAFIKEFTKLIKKPSKKESKIFLIIQDARGLSLKPFDIKIPEMDIEINYGKEWKEKHQYLLDIFTKKIEKSGIVLLHGIPGTGKTQYIKHLISKISENRTVVYLPNQLINSITDPGFLPLMSDYPDSVLIIEDAEEAIKARKNGGYTVDKLLNLSDGILSDFMGSQIICTFNTDISNIDEALLRKGRLIFKHEFKKLSIEDAQKLSDKLGFSSKIKEPMSLSEIYNQDDKFILDSKDEKRIGF